MELKVKLRDKDENGEGYPEIVYKYRDWAKPEHTLILKENELFLASPADFNDPFDCRITKDFSLLNTKEKITQYVNKIAIETYDHWSTKDPAWVQAMLSDYENRLQNIPKEQADYDAYTHKKGDEHYGIMCFGAVWSNILMWSHYANCHKGFVIGFYESPLRDFASTMGSGGMMTYQSTFPRLDPLQEMGIEELFMTRHYKSLQWSYEAEYRISRLFYSEVPSLNDRKIYFPDHCIAEIILGLNTPQVHADEIISICRRKKIPIYKAKKVPFRFQVTCEPI